MACTCCAGFWGYPWWPSEQFNSLDDFDHVFVPQFLREPDYTPSIYRRSMLEGLVFTMPHPHAFETAQVCIVATSYTYYIYHMTVGTGGSPKNSIVWWSKCNKTPLFTVFSAHTQIASMLMLREHMSCLFATIRRFFMTCVDTFSSQHIETA